MEDFLCKNWKMKTKRTIMFDVIVDKKMIESILDKTISQEMYNKLYQELIQRFIKNFKSR